MITEGDVQADLAERLTWYRAQAVGRTHELTQALLHGEDVTRRFGAGLPEAYSGFRAVDGCWLTWITDQPGDEERSGSGTRVVVFDGAGELRRQVWPAWPVSRIADRLTQADAGNRFPAVVLAHLEDAGWFPGRRVPEQMVETWFSDRPYVDGVHLHDGARAALREFGGLRIGAAVGRDIEFFPHPVSDSRWTSASVVRGWDIAKACPVAEDHQQRSGGLIFLVAEAGDCPAVVIEGDHDPLDAGDSVDDMLTRCLTGGRLDVLDWSSTLD